MLVEAAGRWFNKHQLCPRHARPGAMAEMVQGAVLGEDCHVHATCAAWFTSGIPRIHSIALYNPRRSSQATRTNGQPPHCGSLIHVDPTYSSYC